MRKQTPMPSPTDEIELSLIKRDLESLQEEVTQATRRYRKLERQTRKGDRYKQIESLEWLENYAIAIKVRSDRMRETIQMAHDAARIREEREQD